MKKISKLLLITGLLISTFSGNEINAIAEDIMPTPEIVEGSEPTPPTVTVDPNTETNTESLAPSTLFSSTVYSGTFGTSNWTIDSDGVLHIGAGTFADTGNASPWHSYAINIKEIVFEGNVTAAAKSSHLFYDLVLLTAIEGLEKLDTSNVTNMYGMFASLFNLTSLDVSSFDTSNVTTMSSMFAGLHSLTSLDVSNFDTSNVINMAAMFSNLTSLTSLDVSNFDTSNVTDMSLMFWNSTSLTSLDVSRFNTSNVTDMYSMFADLHSLTSLDVSSFDTSNVTDMSYMFYGTDKLYKLSLGNRFRSLNDTGLHEIIESGYTGGWIGDNGLIFPSSNDFMLNFQGASDASTYVWQKIIPSTPKKPSTWDDGGPFTTDKCGNIFDRWGNEIYKAPSCKVSSGYKVPNTGVK